MGVEADGAAPGLGKVRADGRGWLTCPGWLRRLFFVLVVLAMFSAVRIVHSGASGFDLHDLAGFEAASGVDLPDWYADHPWLISGLRGDGQVFVALAADPFAFDTAHLIGSPVYRYSRIGFSLAGWIVVGGNVGLVPVGLTVVSLLSVGVLAWIADRVREETGPWAWLILVNPSVLIGFIAGTAEPFGLAALVLAMSGVWWAAVMVGIGRPSFLTALADRWALLGVALVGALGVRWFASFLFGVSPFEGAETLGWPLVGYVAEPSLSVWVLALFAGAITVVGMRNKWWSWVLSGVLVLCYAPRVLDMPSNAWRTSGMLWVLVGFSAVDAPMWTFTARYLAGIRIRLFGQAVGRAPT